MATRQDTGQPEPTVAMLTLVDDGKSSEEACDGSGSPAVARPIGIPDDALLDAAEQGLDDRGPSGFTLARAAACGGVSGATLIKRFGSKERLFLPAVPALGRFRWMVSSTWRCMASTRR